MAGEVTAAAEGLEQALRTVPALRVVRDPGATVDGPTAMLAVPALTWESHCVEPTGATWVVHLVVDVNERAVERLWDLIGTVSAAIDKEFLDGSVIRADPGTWSAAGSELPSYALQVDVALGG